MKLTYLLPKPQEIAPKVAARICRDCSCPPVDKEKIDEEKIAHTLLH